jgi:hypothetical protein
MNEKLKELAEQAGFEITPWGNESLPCVHQEGPIDVELTKFSELLIRECVTKMALEIMDEQWVDDAVKNTYEHFGVDE